MLNNSPSSTSWAADLFRVRGFKAIATLLVNSIKINSFAAHASAFSI